MSNFTGKCTLPFEPMSPIVAMGSFPPFFQGRNGWNAARWLCPVGEQIGKTYMTFPKSEASCVMPICTLVALVQLGNQPGGLLKGVGFSLNTTSCGGVGCFYAKWIGFFDAFYELWVWNIETPHCLVRHHLRNSLGSAQLPCEVGLRGALVLFAPGLTVLTGGM